MQSLSQSQDRESLKRSGTGSVSDREKLSSPFFSFLFLSSSFFFEIESKENLHLPPRRRRWRALWTVDDTIIDKKIFPRAFVQMTPTFLFARSIEYPAFTLSIAFLSLRFEKEEKKRLIYLFIARRDLSAASGEWRWKRITSRNWALLDRV